MLSTDRNLPVPRGFISIGCKLATLALLTVGALSALAQKVTVPGTTLKIDLPAGWRIGPPRTGYPPTDVLWHDANPRYSVQVSEGVTGLATTPQETANSSCNLFLGVMLSIPAAKTSTRISRPAYFPDTYYGSVVELPGKLWLGCVNAGSRIVAVTINLKDGQPQPELLTPLLKNISEAAFSGQTFIEPPGRVHLKLLDLDVPVPKGKWSAQESNNSIAGRNDMVVRVLGKTELSITPLINPFPGPCSFAGADGKTAGSVVNNPSYVSQMWSPAALVQLPPPETFVTAIVCRDIGSGRSLMAQIMEEGQAIPEADYDVISGLLDGIANAVDAKISSEGITSLRTNVVALPLPPTPASTSIPVSAGVSQGLLVKQVPPIYPPLARQARIQGTVVLHAIIDKDGNIESLELVSGHPMLVNAAMDAVKQWQYKPYVVDGAAVEVQTTINVDFSLVGNPQTTKPN
jgi:TonB family protein